jgi:hypothetical protein
MSPHENEVTKRAHFAWQEHVAARTDLRPTYKVVLLRLALHRNPKSGRCDPAYSTLAKGAGVSERTAKRAVAKGLQLDLIAVAGSGGGSRYKHNQYKFRYEGVAQQTPLSCGRGGPAVTQGVAQQSPKYTTNEGHTFGVPLRESGAVAPPLGGASLRDAPKGQEERAARSDAGSQEGLVALHRMWVRGHPSDATAQQHAADAAAWTDAMASGATPEAIMAGAEKWIAAADAPRFLPKLSHWLNDHGWDKEAPRKTKANGANGGGRWSGRRSRRHSTEGLTARVLRRVQERRGMQ